MTQKEQILDYMARHGSITPLEALISCSCFRLGARIWELKRDGQRITKDMVEVDTDQGKARVARYRLAGVATQEMLGL